MSSEASQNLGAMLDLLARGAKASGLDPHPAIACLAVIGALPTLRDFALGDGRAALSGIIGHASSLACAELADPRLTSDYTKEWRYQELSSLPEAFGLQPLAQRYLDARAKAQKAA